MYNKDCHLIFEKYASAYSSNRIFNDLYNRDIRAIEELLIEAGFFKNLGQNIGNKLGNLKQTAQNIYSTGANLAQNVKQGYQAGSGAGGGNNEVANIVRTIIGNIFKKKEDFVKGIQMIASGKVDQEGVKTLQNALSQPTQKNESNKAFLARTVFTESNILNALKSNSLLINEMMNVGIPNAKANANNNDVSGQLDKLAQEMAAKIQQLYPDKQAMMNSIPVFNNKVNQYLGAGNQIPPTENPAQQGAANSNQQQGSAQTPQNTQQQGATAAPQGENQQVAGADQAGLLQKVKEFAQSHPKMSVGAGIAALGILAAGVSSVGVAGLVTGAIISALKGAGISTVVEVAKQMIKNKSFNLQGLDLKQIKSRAGLGALFGGLGGVLSTGLGAIGGSLSSIVRGTHSDATQGMTQPQGSTGQNANPQNMPTLQRGNVGNSVPEPTGSKGNQHFFGQNSRLAQMRNEQGFYRDVAKELGAGGQTIQYRAGIPVDAQGNPLLSTDKIQELQRKHHLRISEDPARDAKAAINTEQQMNQVGGSQGGPNNAIYQVAAKNPEFNKLIQSQQGASLIKDLRGLSTSEIEKVIRNPAFRLKTFDGNMARDLIELTISRRELNRTQ